MSRVRVLIVDDAVVIRRIVTDVLSADPQIEVIGAAANGKIGLARIAQLNPDLVTLDIEMPEMDGLQTLRELRKQHPRLPVIMFSTLTARGASATLDALAAGASDYVTKPANVGSVAMAMSRIREELIPKIKALCGNKPAVPVPGAVRPATIVRAAPSRGEGRIEAVVIGVSTGGPNALAEVIPALPQDLPVPVLVVQHMPPVFTRLLAERLNQKSKVHVKEATAGEPALPGHVYVAPGDFHMTIESGPGGLRIGLHQDHPENSCRPAVDVLFRSAAGLLGPAVLGVVLTGMGQDGCRGAGCIRERGGSVIVQDEPTSVVWGMPGAVARAGLAEVMLPLSAMANELSERVMAGRAIRQARRAG
ncbi:MAG: protein-glutamate methylesterase/protein-glutamine glutaminase [Tepidisphaeraceae bacterium]